jgi:L-ornithine N5-oxygenase
MGRLVEHLNLPVTFPLRKEYAQYISWVREFFAESVDYGERAVQVSFVESAGEIRYAVATNNGRHYLARALVIATGRSPYIPSAFAGLSSERVLHSRDYSFRIKEMRETPRSVVVIGGSQSAVEITLDLARRFPESSIHLYVRGPALRLKDTSPFSEESFFPSFVSYYYNASRRSKNILDRYLRSTNYSSVDDDVLHDLYLLIYEQRLDHAQRVFLQKHREVRAAADSAGQVSLTFEEIHTGQVECVTADIVILATGFRDIGPEPWQDPYPALMSGIIDQFHFDSDGYLAVGEDYRVTPVSQSTPPLFLNGLCETTHGLGDAGSFSLLSIRASIVCGGLSRALSSTHGKITRSGGSGT